MHGARIGARRLTAGGADGGERKVAGVDQKAGRLLDLGSSAVEHSCINVHDGVAAFTHHVEIGIVSEVIDGPGVSQMHVADDADFGERIERAIDG